MFKFKKRFKIYCGFKINFYNTFLYKILIKNYSRRY